MEPWRNRCDLWNQGEMSHRCLIRETSLDTPPRLIQTWAVSFRLKNDHRRLIALLGKFFFFYALITRPRYLWISLVFIHSLVKKKIFGREDSNKSYKERKILREQKSLTFNKNILKRSYFIFHFTMRVVFGIVVCKF